MIFKKKFSQFISFIQNKRNQYSTIQKYPQFSKILTGNVRVSTPFSMSEFHFFLLQGFVNKLNWIYSFIAAFLHWFNEKVDCRCFCPHPTPLPGIGFTTSRLPYLKTGDGSSQLQNTEDLSKEEPSGLWVFIFLREYIWQYNELIYIYFCWFS